ncbi:hypothetical protein HYALB_00009690 [Hymenoscyphus albidus]|uniref:Uncharacterized protein n=1 Tax=Hymenoscyphus albidus TaxID=595503 RepID=A0A9N9L9G8_9HELO|nr:hypothetical protein HYALB_00009690 [Hymenoscyphus albidus]
MRLSEKVSSLTAATFYFCQFSLATPTCSNITDITHFKDNPSKSLSWDKWSETYLKSVNCPSENKTPCSFDIGKTYNLTARRHLKITVSQLEAEKIYLSIHNSRQSLTNETLDVLMDLNTTLNHWDKDGHWLQVQPGNNRSLAFHEHRMRTTGVLNGCANETLNGQKFEVVAPFLETNGTETYKGQKVENGKVLAGTWIWWDAPASNLTTSTPAPTPTPAAVPAPVPTAGTKGEDKKNSGNSFMGDIQFLKTVMALLVVTVGFGML